MINTEHENPKYLPGVRLPANVLAVPDLEQAARDASVLVFVLPHQFVGKRESLGFWLVDLGSGLRSYGADFHNPAIITIHPPPSVLPTLRSCVRPGALAVSLIKVSSPRASPRHQRASDVSHPPSAPQTKPYQGLDFAADRPVLMSDLIRQGLGPVASDVCVLMGANVADEVARDEVRAHTSNKRDAAN